MSLRYGEPDAGPPILTDVVGTDNVQVLKPAFGPADTATRVTQAAPLPARDYHGGDAAWDSGLVAVAAGTPALLTTAATHFLDALCLVNRTEEVQAWELRDGLGASYAGRDLEPRECRVVPFYGLAFAGGVALGAAASGALWAQVKGTR